MQELQHAHRELQSSFRTLQEEYDTVKERGDEEKEALAQKVQQLSALVSQHSSTNRDLADLITKLEEDNRNWKSNADTHVSAGAPRNR
jgi:hypothetical protein